MTQPQQLNTVRLPARLDSIEAALLGFREHDIPILTRAKLLRPLGNPAPNSGKYFSAVALEALAKDEAWLARATRFMTRGNVPGPWTVAFATARCSCQRAPPCNCRSGSRLSILAASRAAPVAG